MKTVAAMLSIALLSLAGPVWAQEGAGEEPYDVEKAIREVREMLAKSEKLLVESLKEKADAEAAAQAGAATKQAIEELLDQSRNSGSDAAKKMIEIIENAPQGSGGGGGGESDAQRKPEDASEDARRKAEEEKLENRDPQNAGGEPKSPRESKEESESEDRTKPQSETGEEATPDPAKEFLPRLPPEVRQAYENRDWQRIPARWREYVEEYAKRLAEAESSRRQE